MGKRDKALLTEALTDLDLELERMRKKKENHENNMKKCNAEIIMMQNEQVRLRDQISALVEREARANIKMNDEKDKLAMSKNKIAEIIKIKEEMVGI